MNPTRDLPIPADVAAVIGADKAAQLVAGPWPAEFRCPVCGHRDRVGTGLPVTAGLDLHPGGPGRLWLAHRACTPGGVVHTQHSLPDPHRDSGKATGIAAVVPGTTAGAWPLILLELAVVAVDQQGAESIDLVITVDIQLGMHHVGDIFHPPPIVPGWRVDLPRGNRPGAVHDPAGDTPLQPPPTAARRLAPRHPRQPRPLRRLPHQPRRTHRLPRRRPTQATAQRDRRRRPSRTTRRRYRRRPPLITTWRSLNGRRAR